MTKNIYALRLYVLKPAPTFFLMPQIYVWYYHKFSNRIMMPEIKTLCGNSMKDQLKEIGGLGLLNAALNTIDLAIKSIVLFGSYAREEQTKYSDIDLFIIYKRTFPRHIIRNSFPYDKAVSIIACDVSQLSKFSEKNPLLMSDISTQGILLYGDALPSFTFSSEQITKYIEKERKKILAHQLQLESVKAIYRNSSIYINRCREYKKRSKYLNSK